MSRLTRTRPTGPQSPRFRVSISRERPVDSATAGLVAVLVGVLAPGIASAETVNGIVTVDSTPPPSTRSISVSVTQRALDQCFTLGGATRTVVTFPNGRCMSTTDVTITYSGPNGHVFVNGGAATGVDLPGDSWALQSSTSPGSNQYSAWTHSSAEGGATGIALTTTPTCEDSFRPSQTDKCAASEANNQSMRLQMIGPADRTTTATQFAIPFTWTAVA